jgi:hypothetical protein
MSYYITISGHTASESVEESKAFEEEVAAKAREFVATLEGVTAANMTSGHLPQQDLTSNE